MRDLHIHPIICGTFDGQEMRRSAPAGPGPKRQRTDAESDALSSHAFLELTRFNYQASESLPEKSQGFLITSAFRRCACMLTHNQQFLPFSYLTHKEIVAAVIHSVSSRCLIWIP